MGGSFLLLLFFLTKKVTKKSRRFDAGISFSSKFSYYESPFGKVIYSEGLKVEVSASCCYTFLEALYFSLYVNSYLEQVVVKNKALDVSLNLKRWHYSQVMVTYSRYIVSIDGIVEDSNDSSTYPRSKEIFQRLIAPFRPMYTL